jgi:guanylate kinase
MGGSRVNGAAIFIFTGTSGSGRKTIARRVSQALGLQQVISVTTRAPRNPDRPDTDYHYLSRESFDQWEKEGGFAQIAEIDGNRYGLRKRELEEALTAGHRISLVLNRQGAEAVKHLYGDRVFRIFIYLDKQSVRERLESKGTRFDVIESYLDHYADEVTYRKNCEFIIENVDLDRTAEGIIRKLQDD